MERLITLYVSQMQMDLKNDGEWGISIQHTIMKTVHTQQYCLYQMTPKAL